MKLLLYSHFFAPSIGGVETLVQSLARGLAESISPDGQKKFAVTLVTQTPAANFDDSAFPYAAIRHPSPFQLWSLIRATDVVHIAGTAIVPIIFGLAARKPIVVEHHGFQSICPNGQLLIEPAAIPCPGHFMAGHHSICLRCNSTNGWFASFRLWALTFLRRFLCARVAANITPTQWLGKLVQLPRVTAIPHGLDSSSPLQTRSQPASPPTIAFLGRLVTTKGVTTLIDAAQILRAQNKPFSLLIIGDGPERQNLQQFVKFVGLDAITRFTGRLPAPERDALLNTVSLVVVPSLGGEVFGLVVAENMLRGLPVIASNLGAFVEVLGSAGLTFETGNAQALAVQLAKLLDDPVFRAALGQQARQRASEFCDMQRMLAAHENVYAQVLPKSKLKSSADPQ